MSVNKTNKFENFSITGNGQFKSLTSFEWKDIPPLSIITGPNGSGKSHLLEFVNLIFHQKNALEGTIIEQKAAIRAEKKMSFTNTWKISQDERVHWVGGGYVRSNVTFDPNELLQVFEQVIEAAQRPHSRPAISIGGVNISSDELLKKFEFTTGKSRKQLNIEDLASSYTPDMFVTKNTITNFQLATYFYTYHRRNKEYEYKGDKKGQESLGRPPWEEANEVLEKSNLPYRLNDPTGIDILNAAYHRKMPFTCYLTEINSGVNIDFGEMSSGELMIMSLALLRFNSNRLNAYPKLLLLDEPDSHLHPSMTKQFFDVIHGILVRDKGVRVIMTTHSPSTVALAPEGQDCGVFYLSKKPTKISLVKNREEVISTLTEGLVIVTKTTKFIFVEDEDDAEIYKEIYKSLKGLKVLSDKIPLVFIQASNHKAKDSGGNKAVQTWVERFNGLSNTIHGLIDKDSGIEKNVIPRAVEFIDRYSIENYLFDPINVYACLLDYKNSVPDIEGIDIGFGEIAELRNIEDEKLQKIANYILEQIEEEVLEALVQFEEKITHTKLSDKNLFQKNMREKVKVSFVNSRTLEYPKWIIDGRGKTVGQVVMKKFTATGAKKIDLERLSAKMKSTLMIPNDLLSKFKKLQEI